MNKININNIYLKFILENKFLSILSFTTLIFYVLLTIFFPKYYGNYISNLNNNKNFVKDLIIMIAVYIFLWFGTLFQFYIINTKFLKKIRIYFIKELFIPIWSKIEKSEYSDNFINSYTKNLLTLTISSSTVMSAILYQVLPLFLSVILFIYYLPNIYTVKLFIIIIFIIISVIIYKYSKNIKNKSSERLEQTKIILSYIDDYFKNKLSIFNFNSFEKEKNKLLLECNKQEIKCYESGLSQFILVLSIMILLLFGLLFPIYLNYKLLKYNEFKSFLIYYLPMIFSMILIIYATLNRIISFTQALGEQDESIDNINHNLKFDNIVYKKYKNKSSKLEIKNIQLSFHNNRVFKDLNLKFEKGITLIEGPIGSGKSCILKMIFGILNYEQGDIFYQNKSKNSMNIREWRKNIMYINQFSTLFELKNVNENIYYGNCNNNFCNKKKIDNLIKEIGLEKKFFYLINNTSVSNKLSGGEKQIVTLIRSIINDDINIYLIDEPTASLDYHTKEIIYKLIKKLNNKNKTIIIVTHDEKLRKISNYILNIEEIK